MKGEKTIDWQGILAIFATVEAIAGNLPNRQYRAWSKEDATPVTSLDIEVQAHIIAAITGRFPGHSILFEEGEQTIIRSASPFTWVIDPIDGTANMMAGKPEYSISLGLMHKSRFIAAIVAFPALGECYSGTIHDRLALNRRPYAPPTPDPTCREMILCSKTYERLKQVAVNAGFTPAFYYCATYSILKVLKREALAYHTVRTNIYDVGPMSFLLELSGGSSYDGSSAMLEFSPSLDKIPFYLGALSLEPVGFLFK